MKLVLYYKELLQGFEIKKRSCNSIFILLPIIPSYVAQPSPCWDDDITDHWRTYYLLQISQVMSPVKKGKYSSLYIGVWTQSKYFNTAKIKTLVINSADCYNKMVYFNTSQYFLLKASLIFCNKILIWVQCKKGGQRVIFLITSISEK